MKLVATPSKSEHWYDRQGNSCHDADLRRARKENLYPSVTSVLNVRAKPGLEAWKRNETILAALTLPRIDGETLEAFAARVAVDMDSHSSRAASIGTALHQWAEDYCNRKPSQPPEGYANVCYQVQEWIDQNLDLDRGQSESSFCNKELGYAGRIDWNGWTKDGRFIILDFKSQGVKTGKRATFYPEHNVQLAGYCQGKHELIETVNLIISSVPDNPVIAERWWDSEERNQGWQVFKHCLAIWKLDRGYWPERWAD